MTFMTLVEPHLPFEVALPCGASQTRRFFERLMVFTLTIASGSQTYDEDERDVRAIRSRFEVTVSVAKRINSHCG